MKKNILLIIVALFAWINLHASSMSNDSTKLESIQKEMVDCMSSLNNRTDYNSDSYLRTTIKTAKRLNELANKYYSITNDSSVFICSFMGEVITAIVYESHKQIDSAYVHAQSALSLYQPYGKYMCEADSSKKFYQLVFGCDGLIGIEREMSVKKNDIEKALYYCHIIDDSCSFYKFDMERVQSYIRQGDIYEQINDYENAIDSHIKALDLRLKHPFPTNYPLSSQVYNGLLEVISRLYSKQKLLRDNESLKQKFDNISNSSYWNEFFKTHPLDFCEEEEKEGQTFWISALFNTLVRLLKESKQYDTIFSIEDGLDDFYTRNFGKESIEYAEYLITYKNIYLRYSENELDSDAEKKLNKEKADEKEKLALEIWNNYFEKNSIDELVLKYQTLPNNASEDKGRLHKILSSYALYQTYAYYSSIKSGNYDNANDAIKKRIYIEENVFKNSGDAYSYLMVGDVSLFEQDYVSTEKYYNKALSLAYEQRDTIEMAETNMRLYRLYEITSQRNDYKAKHKLHDAYDQITKYSFHSIQKSDILKSMADLYKKMYNYETAHSLFLLSINEKLHCGQKLLDEDYINEADFMSTYMPLDKDSALFEHIVEIATKETFSQNVLKASELLGTYYVVRLNEYEKGVLYYNKAAKVAKELRDSVSEAKCLAEIGTILFACKNYEEAFVYMQKAEKVNPNLKYSELLSLMAYISNDSIVNMRLPLLYNNTTIELKKKMLSINTKGREWMVALMPYDVFKSMPYYYPNLNVCSDIAYNATLLYKGLLQNTQKSISEYIANSNDEALIRQFSRLQIINNESVLNSRAELDEATKTHLESANLEMSILDKLSKKNLMSDLEITYDKVSKHLDHNDVAIEFVEINKLEPLDRSAICYGALIIRKGYKHPVFVELDSKDEIGKDINALLNSFNKGSRLTITKWKTVSERLYKKIWGKLEDHIHPGENVFFSTDGLLHKTPIEFLSDSLGNYANERYNMFRLSSTRELCKKRKEGISKAVLYGGLLYDAEAKGEEVDPLESFQQYDDSSTRSGWKYLPASEAEVDSISSLLSSNGISIIKRKGLDGTEESFKELSGLDLSLVHIATHGFYFPQKEVRYLDYFQSQIDISPMKRSGLIMTGGQTAWMGKKNLEQEHDGILTSEEISTVDLSNVGLVVLSACQTGLGDIDSGAEGVFGIQRAFKLAGARSLLMSLWKVDDVATSYMMQRFYSRMLSGETKHNAFKTAQKEVRNKYPNPYYWAGFVMLD